MVDDVYIKKRETEDLVWRQIRSFKLQGFKSYN